MRRTLLAIFLGVLFTHSALSQEKELKNYVITKWGLEDGLPQSSINDILQTQDGYIWLATFGGLVRFDGNSFTTFNRSNTEGMTSDRVLHLFEDRSGVLWLATETAFIRFVDGKGTPFFITQNSQVFAPNHIVETSEGDLWLSVNGKAYQYKDSVFIEREVITDSLLADEAIKDSSGAWINLKRKLLRTKGDSVIQVLDMSSFLRTSVIRLIEYPKDSGVLFFATSGEGVIKYDNGVVESLNEKEGLPSKDIWRFYIDKKQKLWVLGYGGITQWDGSKFVPFYQLSVDKDVQLMSLFEDKEENYWVGSSGEGLFKLQPSIISTIDNTHGFHNEIMLSLSTLNNGEYLFSTNCGGVYEWRNGKAIPSEINKYLPNQCNWSVYQDSKNRLWFGSRVLYQSNSLNNPGRLINEADGFNGYDIFAITEDSKGNIWIGCLNGVYVYDGKNFTSYTTENGLSYNETRVFYEDEKGVMWVGTTSGLNVIKDGVVSSFVLGKEENNVLPVGEPYIRAIHKDNEGVMWFGSYGNGIFRLKEGEFSNITQKDGLFDNIVSHIVEDENGYFWMGSNQGIFRVSKDDLNDFLDGKISEVRSYSYGASEGMNSAETNGGFQPSVISDSLGNIYFPTVAGVAVVSTKDVKKNEVKPLVYIENLRTAENEIPISESITLSYNTPFLEIGYTALSFTGSKNVEFKYKMEGLNNDWIDVKNNRTAIYTKIPPGNYIFRVTASNNDGVWNEEGASIEIIVPPPFWMTYWFYSLVVVTFMLSGAGIFYSRLRFLQKENEKQKRFSELLIESQENERSRIASELHDGLGQQILVIKNRAEMAKQQIQNPDKISDQLTEILHSAQRSINDVRNIAHDLRPVFLEKFGLTEALNTLCDQLQESTSIEWSYHIDEIDEYISGKKEIYFFRVVQEAIKNILTHSGASEASVIVRCNSNYINVIIWDDGKGFDPKIIQDKAGLGFLGMEERITAMNGNKLSFESNFENGTTIKFEIPLKPNG